MLAQREVLFLGGEYMMEGLLINDMLVRLEASLTRPEWLGFRALS